MDTSRTDATSNQRRHHGRRRRTRRHRSNETKNGSKEIPPDRSSKIKQSISLTEHSLHRFSIRSKVAPANDLTTSATRSEVYGEPLVQSTVFNGNASEIILADVPDPTSSQYPSVMEPSFQSFIIPSLDQSQLQKGSTNRASSGNVSYMHHQQDPLRNSSVQFDSINNTYQKSFTQDTSKNKQKKSKGKNNGNKTRDERLNEDPKRKKYRKYRCCRCTPLCTFLSLLGAFFIASLLAAIIVAALFSRTTTRSTTTTTTTSTTSRTTTTSSTTSSTTSTTSTSSTTSSTTSTTTTTSRTTSTSTTTSSTTTSTTSVTTTTSRTTTTTSITTTTSQTTTTTTVVCLPPCLNGGTCVLPSNTCICNEEVWTGPRCQTPVRILWTFDNNLLDFYGNFPGTPVNNPTYHSPGINGYGSCLYLNASARQSVVIPSPPFLNMAFTSFSLSAWVRANSLRAGCSGTCCDNAIFGQFDQNTQSRSLHILVRDRRIYLGFFSDDTEGNQNLQSNRWYHMAYVYDNPARRQFVYVNGILDESNSPRGPYRGIDGDLTIGTNGVCAPSNTWDGCIDQVTYFARAKSAAEVLRDATLTVSYTFNNTLLDDGPLGINGTGTNVQYSNAGRSGPALDLSTTPSFARAAGLVYLGTDGHPYSISIWIRPAAVTSGTIVHVSPSSGATTWSMPMLGFDSTGRVHAQGCRSSGTVPLIGPILPVNQWTHIAITYSQSTRLRLWINGIQAIATSSSFTSATIDGPVTITIGASPIPAAGSCASTSIVAGQYSGLIDEFQLYSRELNAAEVVDLAT